MVGTNRKLLVFAKDELPEMTRGKGVILQRFKGATLSDALVFRLEDSLSWTSPGGRNRTGRDLTTWRGKRAAAGRAVPTGSPRPPRFSG